MQPIYLGVNIDHVATLRQARGTRYPDPVQAAMIAEQAGADSITVHLREDRRHIQERDILLLKETMLTPMNLEMAVTEEILAFAEKVRPEYCCLVPERREELTTEGGLDVAARIGFYQELVKRFGDAGIPVSLFIDPDTKQIESSAQTGAGAVEINTGRYSESTSESKKAERLSDVRKAVEFAHEAGLVVHAGHGLHYKNVSPIAALPWVDELNIGHSIVSESVFVGFSNAISTMKELIEKASAVSR